MTKHAPLAPMPLVALFVSPPFNGDKEKSAMDVNLPAMATSFAVLKDNLAPGGTSQLGIGAISVSANISAIETTFTTAAKIEPAPNHCAL